MRHQKPASKALMRSWQNTRQRITNHRGRTLQTKISRTNIREIEVMKHKTKNRKLTQQNKKGNTQAKSPSLMQEKTAACFSLLYSLDFQTIKHIARQKIKNHRISKKCKQKTGFPFRVSGFIQTNRRPYRERKTKTSRMPLQNGEGHRTET